MQLCLAFVLLPLLLIGCQRADAPKPRLTHEAYIWQRQWTPAVASAAAQGGATFAGYRVLAAESAQDGSVSAFEPDLAVLARSAEPVTAVIRVDGGTPPADTAALRARIGEIAQRWRDAGVRLAGFEIDHDCATARLPDYAQLLAALHSGLPAGLKLSITELPAWLDAPALPALLDQVDDSVLQVQVRPAAPFDPALARRWIDAHAARSTKPFRIALPAYVVTVDRDEDGPAAGTASAAGHVDDTGTDEHEARVAPEQVEDLLGALQQSRPKQVAGVAWFRLPTEDDRRAWSLATLRAVIDGESLRPVVKVSFDADASGAHDLVLANVGPIDAPVPAVLIVAALGCDAGDALEGFRLERMGDDWRFVATGEALIRAGRVRHVGWLRCSDVLGMKVDEH